MTWGRLRENAQRIGDPESPPMLTYVAEVHERSIHPPLPPHPWEEIGPGYCYAPARRIQPLFSRAQRLGTVRDWPTAEEFLDGGDLSRKNTTLDVRSSCRGRPEGRSRLKDDCPLEDEQMGNPD